MIMHINILSKNCTRLSIENIISIIDLCLSVCMLVIAVLGVVLVYSYRKHQKEATYGFYANMTTLLVAFKLHIHSATETPVDWMNILGKKKDEIDDDDKKRIKPVVEFCRAFFAFLSTASNQIPPSRKKCDLLKWEKSFNVLRNCLADITNYDLQAYPRWETPEITNTNRELNSSVDDILQLIEKHKKI